MQLKYIVINTFFHSILCCGVECFCESHGSIEGDTFLV